MFKPKLTLAAILLMGLQSTQSIAQCTASITALGSTTFCQGSSVVVDATPGGTSYQWFVNGSPVAGAITSQFTATTSGDVTVVVNFGACTAPSNMITVTENVVTPPTASDVNFCVDHSTTALTASGANLLWYTVATGGTPLPNAPVPSSAVIGAFTWYVSQTVGGCESDRTPLNVTILDTPTITATSNSPICAGETLQLTVTNTGTGTTWFWEGPPSFTSTLQNPTISNAIIGQSGIYVVVATLNGCAGSSPVNVVINPAPVVSSSSSLNPTTLNSPDGSITLEGLAPNTSYAVSYVLNGTNMMPIVITSNANGQIIINNLGAGTYDNIVASNGGCGSSPVGPIVLAPGMITADSVWPGDANYDLVANNDDVLEIGLAYGETGATRIGASNNWIAQFMADWGTLQVNGMDMKHADCDGNGTVDADDANAVSANYGQTHQKGFHIPQAKVTGFPDLYFDLTGINMVAGTTVSIPIKLGTSSMPMSNILGLAANAKVSGITLNSSPVITASSSWMGNGTNTINFTKGVTNEQTDWTLVRTDHSNVSGDGTIAMMTIDIPASATGDAVFYFDDVKMIDNAGNVLTDYNVIDDTATVIPTSVTTATSLGTSATIIPNPSGAEAILQVNIAQKASIRISIIDVVGRTVWQAKENVKAGVTQVVLPAYSLNPGIYSILVHSDEDVVNQVLKWVKK